MLLFFYYKLHESKQEAVERAQKYLGEEFIIREIS